MRTKKNQEFWKKFDKKSDVEQGIIKIIGYSYRGLTSEEIRKTTTGLAEKGLIDYSIQTTLAIDRILKALTTEQTIEKSKDHSWNVIYSINNRGLITEIISEIMNNDKNIDEVIKIMESSMNGGYSYNSINRYALHLRAFIVSIFKGNPEEYEKKLIHIKTEFGSNYYEEITYLQDVFKNILDEEYKVIDLKIKDKIIFELARMNVSVLNNNEAFIEYLEERINFVSDKQDLVYFITFYYLFVGDWNKIYEIIKKTDFPQLEPELLGCLSFLKGQAKEAIAYFETALEVRKKVDKSVRKPVFNHISNFFYVAAILSLRDISLHSKARNYLKLIKTNFNSYASLFMINGLINILENDRATGVAMLQNAFGVNSYKVAKFFYYLCTTWGETDIFSQGQNIEDLMLLASKNGYHWLAFALAGIRKRSNNKISLSGNIVREFENKYPHNLVDLVHVYFAKEEDWLKSLKILQQLSADDDKKKVSTDGRVVWHVNFKGRTLAPKEQKINKNGSWSAGKSISIKRLKEGGSDFASLQDMKIVSSFDIESYYSGYNVDFGKACLSMIGHPHLYLEDTDTNVEVIKAEPEILIEEAKTTDSMIVSFSVDASEIGIKIEKETNTRYKIFHIKEVHKKIFENLGRGKLIVPKKGKELLSKTLGSMVNIVNVNSSVSNFGIDLPRVASNPQIFALLLPFNNGGLKLELMVKPFTTSPPYHKPGKSPETVIGEINKQKVQATRNLNEEKSNAKKIIQACQILSINDSNDYEWSFEDPQDCLEVLYQLEELQNKVIIEWPEGQKFKIAYRASTSSASLHIKKQNDWFDIDAEIRLNETNVIKMAELLEMLDNSKNRFIQLKDGQFLALTEVFRKRLQEIKAFTEKTKDGLRFHNLAALTMDDITQDFENIKTDTNWKNQIKKIKNARAINPKVPTTLKTELRNYQIDGFKWLAQLASWGVGACLADDMGLGKTIQGLALILHRADEGPTLVVAPATVARNWMGEAAKFAPTMNTILFGGKEREQQISELKEHDLLVCSYGLLQQEAEMFSKVKWATIILDEAQNIKNMSTKRSKAAMDLQSDFKMITTGTPVENHLGELWNLFRFINPGLLGSLNNFNENFAIQIERNQDVERQKQLQKLLKPFILRRRKSQVLEELPSKTEITLTVEMSKDESAFYEALRKRAIEKLQDSSAIEGAHEGEKRLRILAEIMKLRQASCNTKLVLKDSDISSSKLELLLETAEELRENGHKALIFSQFVGHLTLIREAFDARAFSYKYLDGSTPMKKREEAIKEFQNGEADFFLISLKAGGVGLNLTAADYVIHMDPWWNPAVEDQASDRAHRIGQQRPVTIYRLVTKGTIEEKIVSLHQNKRDLADNLLEGTEMSAKISSEDLLNLIKQG